jgi:hypothetical protein
MQAAPACAEAAEATATDPGGEVALLAVLDDDRHDGSKGSAGHPTRVLPPVEIDLPGGRGGRGVFVTSFNLQYFGAINRIAKKKKFVGELHRSQPYVFLPCGFALIRGHYNDISEMTRMRSGVLKQLCL